jgi:hypothetical protein
MVNKNNGQQNQSDMASDFDAELDALLVDLPEILKTLCGPGDGSSTSRLHETQPIGDAEPSPILHHLQLDLDPSKPTASQPPSPAQTQKLPNRKRRNRRRCHKRHMQSSQPYQDTATAITPYSSGSQQSYQGHYHPVPPTTVYQPDGLILEVIPSLEDESLFTWMPCPHFEGWVAYPKNPFQRFVWIRSAWFGYEAVVGDRYLWQIW